MADELVFYTNPQSRGRLVRWMLEEVGQPYRTEVLDYAGSMKAPAYLAINPMGKVPAITHGGAVVTECAAICAYLADAFPQAKLAPPPGDRRRAPYYRWLFFTSGPVEFAISNKALGFAVPLERERMMGYGNFDQALKTLEDAVSKSDYITGDSFSAADVYVGSHLNFNMMFGTIDKRPAFERYVARLTARPAFARARQRAAS
jgi:glutathione S-transferase